MIYILYGVSGPIKPLFIDALKRGNNNHIHEHLFNRKGSTRSEKAYDSRIDLEFFSEPTERAKFEAKFKKYVYVEPTTDRRVQQTDKFGINEEQLAHCAEHGIDHFIICHSTEVIEKILTDYKDTEFLLLDLKFQSLLPALLMLCNKYNDVDTDGRHNKISILGIELEKLRVERGSNYSNLKYQRIQVLNDDDPTYEKLVELTWAALNPVVSKNAKYYWWGSLLNTKRFFGEDNDVNDKVAFTIDYKRVLSSSPYRRLQDKAQVFPLEKHDYPRTRLTHSGECSTIAEELGEYVVETIKRYKLNHSDIPDNPLCEKIPVLLRTAALLHDMGNPPFGHFGEKCIRDWFTKMFSHEQHRADPYNLSRVGDQLSEQKNDFIHYEGNAQLFRLLTTLDSIDQKLNLTYAVLAVAMKYPTSSVAIDRDVLERKKPGYFFSEKGYFEKLRNEMNLKGRHPLTFMLEAADDISYLTADLEDSYKRGLVSVTQIKEAFASHNCKDIVEKIDEYCDVKYYDIEKEDSARAIYSLRNYLQSILIKDVAASFEENYTKIMKGDFQQELILCQEKSRNINSAIRKILEDHVYDCIGIARLAIKASKIINGLLDSFIPAALSIDDQESPALHSKVQIVFSENYKKVYDEQRSEFTGNDALTKYHKILLALDNICGMTDQYANSEHDTVSAQ